MKSHDELKKPNGIASAADGKAKKNKRANAEKGLKRHCKEFGFKVLMFKGSLAEGWKK